MSGFRPQNHRMLMLPMLLPNSPPDWNIYIYIYHKIDPIFCIPYMDPMIMSQIILYINLRLLTPPMETPDPPFMTPLGPLKQVVLTPHDIPWSLRATVIHSSNDPKWKVIRQKSDPMIPIPSPLRQMDCKDLPGFDKVFVCYPPWKKNTYPLGSPSNGNGFKMIIPRKSQGGICFLVVTLSSTLYWTNMEQTCLHWKSFVGQTGTTSTVDFLLPC